MSTKLQEILLFLQKCYALYEQQRGRGRPNVYSNASMTLFFMVMMLKKVYAFKAMSKYVKEHYDLFGFPKAPSRKTIRRRFLAYMVSIGGFDTHADQEPFHSTLLNYVAGSVKAFFEDLAASGHKKNVLAMTFSEFGRTIFENGSLGTDHGTGAPMLLFGGDDSIGSGFHGTEPDLDSVDDYGDPVFSVDFRQAYATVLANWLCVHPDVIENVIGNQPWDLTDGLLPESNPPVGSNDRAALLGHNPHPSEAGTIQIKYAIKIRGNVRLLITDHSGHVLRTVVNEFKEKDSYTKNFKPLDYFLPPGEYVYRLETGGKIYARLIRW